jgi:hypothetical protein
VALMQPDAMGLATTQVCTWLPVGTIVHTGTGDAQIAFCLVTGPALFAEGPLCPLLMGPIAPTFDLRRPGTVSCIGRRPSSRGLPTWAHRSCGNPTSSGSGVQ